MSETYLYVAVDSVGRRLRGSEQAASAGALSRALEQRGLLVLEVRPEARGAAAASPARGGSRRQAVLETTRALAALLEAGVPLARSLRISGRVASGELGGVLSSVVADVERGDPLAASLAKHPRFFSRLYVGMVRAADRGGDLAGGFKRLSEHLEREAELRSRLVSASIYPLILLGMGGLAVMVLLLVVLPRFVELLEGSGAALPKSTAALLAASQFLRTGWPLLLALGVGLVAFATWARRTEAGRRAGAGLFLALPGVATLRRELLAARFARLTGLLVAGGAPMLQALDDTAASLDDPLAAEAAGRIRGRVREGVSLADAVGAERIFPPLLPQLVAVGEESGRLADFMLKAAEIFEAGSERALRRLVALAEPAMIVVFGGMVAFVALSLLQAIYGVNADAFR